MASDKTMRDRDSGGAPVDAAEPRRILIVDDNVDSAEMLAELVRIWGHEARTAFDGMAALEAAGQFLPEVVILDLGLPELDGYEVARRLRAHPASRSVTLIAVSGYGAEEDRAKTHSAGFDAHLVKPVAPEDLEAALRTSHPGPRLA